MLHHQLHQSILHKLYILVITNDTIFCTNNDRDTSELEPYQHEEVDSKLIIHVADCVGHMNVAIITVDKDVVALSVAVAI